MSDCSMSSKFTLVPAGGTNREKWDGFYQLSIFED